MTYNCLNILKWTEAQLKYNYDVSLQEASAQELHEALGQAVMMAISDNWSKSKKTRMPQRKAYYISAEYLIGRLVYSNLYNLGILDEMKQLFAERGVDLAILEDVEQQLGYPVFVKPANLGSSIGVSRADDREGLEDSLDLAFDYDRRVLVEKGLDKPIELNCSVLGYDDDVTASPIEMPLSGEQFLDFKEKYLANGGSKGMASLHRVLPAPIEDSLRDRIQQLSCEIFRMMDCKGVVRIDYMFDKATEQVYITEINTIPGSLAFYLWENAGVKYAQLIDRMVNAAMRAHEDRNLRNYAFTSDILKSVSLGGAKGTKGAKGSKGTKLRSPSVARAPSGNSLYRRSSIRNLRRFSLRRDSRCWQPIRACAWRARWLRCSALLRSSCAGRRRKAGSSGGLRCSLLRWRLCICAAALCWESSACWWVASLISAS